MSIETITIQCFIDVGFNMFFLIIITIDFVSCLSSFLVFVLPIVAFDPHCASPNFWCTICYWLYYCCCSNYLLVLLICFNKTPCKLKALHFVESAQVYNIYRSFYYIQMCHPPHLQNNLQIFILLSISQRHNN